MLKIQVITDTDSSLPADLAARYAIIQVPITIHFDDEVYQSCIDIDDKQLFEKIDALKKLPTTAAPSPAAFEKAFQAAFDAGMESIICICVGSKISRTFESAVAAAGEFPGKKISVIDSESLSLCQGFMVLAAAKVISEGGSHEDAVEAAKSLLGRVQLYGALTTLKYLAMGGRVGTMAAGMADLLNIRPILTIIDGKLALLEKVRTQRAAMDRLVNLLVKSAEGKEIVKIGITHINNPAGAAELEKRLQNELKLPSEIIFAEFTPGLSVHGGTGLVAGILQTR